VRSQTGESFLNLDGNAALRQMRLRLSFTPISDQFSCGLNVNLIAALMLIRIAAI
jgi:hypothetical protein